MSIQLNPEKIKTLYDQADEINSEEKLRAFESQFKAIRAFIPTQQQSIIQGKITAAREVISLLKATADEQKHSPLELDLIVANTNQYQNRGKSDPSICTSCAAAFIQCVIDGNSLTPETIQKSIELGRKTHNQAAPQVKRGANVNLATDEVLKRGGLSLRKVRSISGRPESADSQSAHYQRLLTQLQGRGTDVYAIVIKTPYSSAIIYRHEKNDFVYFDSHGESEIGNRAFVRIFKTSKAISDYLTKKYRFDAVFNNDFDFDIDTGQDNPNLYELTLVEPVSSNEFDEKSPHIAPQRPANFNNQPMPAKPASKSCMQTVGSAVYQIGRTMLKYPVATLVGAAALAITWTARHYS